MLTADGGSPSRLIFINIASVNYMSIGDALSRTLIVIKIDKLGDFIIWARVEIYITYNNNILHL